MNSNEKDSRLEINNIIVPGVISNKISEKINNNKFVIVSNGLEKHKINDVLNISIVFILNLLISIKIKGVTAAIIIAIAENKQTKTTLYFINEKNLILK